MQKKTESSGILQSKILIPAVKCMLYYFVLQARNWVTLFNSLGGKCQGYEKTCDTIHARNGVSPATIYGKAWRREKVYWARSEINFLKQICVSVCNIRNLY